MAYYSSGFLMRRWGQLCALCEYCGKRIRKGEKYWRYWGNREWHYQHLEGECPTKKEEPSMPAEHYYMVINAEGISAIVKREEPIKAARYAYDLDKESRNKEWHLHEGRADHHYLAYESLFNGPMTGRMCHVVDLGPITAYDTPGLPGSRRTTDCGRLFDCDHCALATQLEEAEDLLAIAKRKDEAAVPFDPSKKSPPFDPCITCSALVGYEALIEHHAKHHHDGFKDEPNSDSQRVGSISDSHTHLHTHTHAPTHVHTHAPGHHKDEPTSAQWADRPDSAPVDLDPCMTCTVCADCKYKAG